MNEYSSFLGLIMFKTQSCVFYGTCPKRFCDKKNMRIENICLMEGGGTYKEFPLRIQEVEDYIQEIKDFEEIIS